MTARISLSLVSHTNVGKTTLARTLLQRDVGEVRDAAHVTQQAEGHTLVETPEGDRLELWDTPGFGDSVRLARRLAQAGNPLGWFLTEVWDRFRDRPFWSSQRAVRHVLDQADVVLYLVNASEAPDDAAHLDAELQVLTLVGKPVVVLLNQLGAPRAAADEAAQIERWRRAFAARPIVREVLALDAFARCWVQEQRLLDSIAAVLPAGAQAAFARLRTAWRRRAQAVWRQSMQVLAGTLLHTAADRQPLGDVGWAARLKAVGSALGLRRDAENGARAQAMRTLAERLDLNLRGATDRLIRLHGLDGRAAREVLARVAAHYAERAPLHEGKAAAWGGAVTGALAGLKADLLSGGLTLGGGLVAGALVGALGAAGLARGVNVVRGIDQTELHWNDEALDRLAGSALVTYLAVAHYGRGRGEWSASEHPPVWLDLVDRRLPSHRAALHALWREAREAGTAVGAGEQSGTRATRRTSGTHEERGELDRRDGRDAFDLREPGEPGDIVDAGDTGDLGEGRVTRNARDAHGTGETSAAIAAHHAHDTRGAPEQQRHGAADVPATLPPALLDRAERVLHGLCAALLTELYPDATASLQAAGTLD